MAIVAIVIGIVAAGVVLLYKIGEIIVRQQDATRSLTKTDDKSKSED